MCQNMTKFLQKLWNKRNNDSSFYRKHQYIEGVEKLSLELQVKTV